MFHGGRVKVAGNAQNHVGRRDGALVPLQQVFAGDGVNGRVFGGARIRTVRAIGQLGGFAAGDFIQIVIAARDQAGKLLPGQIDLVLAELRIFQQVNYHGKDLIIIILKR